MRPPGHGLLATRSWLLAPDLRVAYRAFGIVDILLLSACFLIFSLFYLSGFLGPGFWLLSFSDGPTNRFSQLQAANKILDTCCRRNLNSCIEGKAAGLDAGAGGALFFKIFFVDFVKTRVFFDIEKIYGNRQHLVQ